MAHDLRIKLRTLLLGGCLLAGSACAPSTPGDVWVPPAPAGGGAVPCGEATARVRVLDILGLPIDGATVIHDAAEHPVAEDGTVVLTVVPGSRLVARVRAPWYTEGTAVLDRVGCGEQFVTVRLLSLGNPHAMDAAAGGEIIAGPVRVDIPSESIIDEAGNPVSGPVDLTIVPLDPATPAVAALPGPLTSIGADGQPGDLISVIMVDLGLWRGEERLQLMPGAEAIVEIILPDGFQNPDALGAAIPAWWYDPEAGAWREEGQGTLEVSSVDPSKLAWVAPVGHFSWHNIDYPLTGDPGRIPTWLSCIDVSVRQNSVPLAGVNVKAVGTDSDIYNSKQGNAPGGTIVKQLISGQTGGGGAGGADDSICLDAWRGPGAYTRVTAELEGYSMKSYKFTLPTGGGYTEPEPESYYPEVECNSTNPAPCYHSASVCAQLEVVMEPWGCIEGRVVQLGSGLGINDATVIGVYELNGYMHSTSTTTRMKDNVAGWYCLEAPPGKVTLRARHRTYCPSGGGYCTYEQVSLVEPKVMANTTCGTGSCVTAANIAIGPNAKGDGDWIEHAAGPGVQEVRDAAIDDAGIAYFAGMFGGEILGNYPSGDDGFLLKYDGMIVDGSPDYRWFIRFTDDGAGTERQEVTAVATDSLGNVIVTGTFRGSLQVRRYVGVNPNYVELKTIVAPPNGQGQNGFVAKFDPDGALKWLEFIGGQIDSYDEFPTGIAVDAYHADVVLKDSVVVTGYATGSLGSVCGSCVGSVGNCSDPCTYVGGKDIFVIKLAQGGSRLFGAMYGGEFDESAAAVSVDGESAMLVTGAHRSDINFGGNSIDGSPNDNMFVVRLAEDGDSLWSQSFGSVGVGDPHAQRGRAVAAYPCGPNASMAFCAMVAGTFSGSIALGGFQFPGPSLAKPGVVYAKLDIMDGSVDWAGAGISNVGAPEPDISDIAVDEEGRMVVAGSFGGSLNFPGATGTSNGVQDWFIATRLASGNVQLEHFGGDMGDLTVASGPRVGLIPGAVIAALAYSEGQVYLDPMKIASWSPNDGVNSAVARIYR